MNADIYAEWLRRQGHRVIRTQSSYWHSSGMGAFQAFPYHWLIDPSEDEISELLCGDRVVAIRYSMTADIEKGCSSHAIVFEGDSYDLENLGHRTRKNVRRGLRNCEVKQISFRQLADQGWLARRETLDRQRRHLSVTPESWRAGYLAAADLPGFNVWGAYVSDRLAAYLVTFRIEDCISVVDQQSCRDYLDLNVNNAITFVMTQHAIAQPGIRCVHYGVEPLDAPGRVSEFKFHMGYAAKPIRQRVLFRPQLAPFANRVSYKLVSTLSKLRPSDRRFSKAKGMLRISLAERNSSFV